jgi:hypothetical protein
MSKHPDPGAISFAEGGARAAKRAPAPFSSPLFPPPSERGARSFPVGCRMKDRAENRVFHNPTPGPRDSPGALSGAGDDGDWHPGSDPRSDGGSDRRSETGSLAAGRTDDCSELPRTAPEADPRDSRESVSREDAGDARSGLVSNVGNPASNGFRETRIGFLEITPKPRMPAPGKFAARRVAVPTSAEKKAHPGKSIVPWREPPRAGVNRIIRVLSNACGSCFSEHSLLSARRSGVEKST